jgi:hypothetical protein
VAALCQRLAALAPALAAAIEAAPHYDSPVLLQGAAACIAVSACITISIYLKAEGSDALRVAAAAKLVLLAGRPALVAVAGALRRSPTAQSCQFALEILLKKQLYGVEACMSFMEACGRLDAIAVFAATTAAPDALIPWLAAACNALLLACRTRRQGATPRAGIH